jgi:hypothetical protein
VIVTSSPVSPDRGKSSVKGGTPFSTGSLPGAVNVTVMSSLPPTTSAATRTVAGTVAPATGATSLRLMAAG